MKNCAVIIDDRPSKQLKNVIDAHMHFLEGWDLKHFSHFKIKDAIDYKKVYNDILKDYQFWSSLNYEKILIFQHDSMILRPIEKEMFNYSYVGAPWKANEKYAREDRAGGNGGISIRGVKEHIALIKKHDDSSLSKWGLEDVFFSHSLPNVAPYEVCSKFGVETEFKLDTCTYHAIDKWLSADECHQIRGQYQGYYDGKKIIK